MPELRKASNQRSVLFYAPCRLSALRIASALTLAPSSRQRASGESVVFLRGTVHQVFDGHSLGTTRDRELGNSISWSLRESMRRWKR